MQVSWIEPDEVRALAALLHGALSTGTGGGWDIQTLPDASQPRPQPLLPQGPEPASSNSEPAPGAVSASVSVSQPQQPQPPSADVVLIREKLRVIRDRAKQAGLIQDEPPVVQTTPSPAAPLRAPMAPPAPPPLSQLPPLASLRPEPAPALAPPAEAAPAPESAQETHASPVSAPAPAFLPLEGPITERLENFTHWVARLTGATEVLLADDHGDMLWGVPTHPSLIVSAMLAVQQELRASAGSLHQPLSILQVNVGDLGDVHVLPCSTRFGLVTVILIDAHTLTESAATSLREALVLTVEVGGS